MLLEPDGRSAVGSSEDGSSVECRVPHGNRCQRVRHEVRRMSPCRSRSRPTRPLFSASLLSPRC